jgi:hypothetical protein
MAGLTRVKNLLSNTRVDFSSGTASLDTSRTSPFMSSVLLVVGSGGRFRRVQRRWGDTGVAFGPTVGADAVFSVFL